ncbi:MULTISPECIES: hypothetical protein [Actinosynnema]|uniref:hypothetical protein n=1 Tax=Actinosynnema TaxID=40566 RepID=UPI0020A23E91|nr:hypothetical protein [Actinosynnema pretiosum]MCP2093799.1 hypothetical protein [Actinosynnema pretiosum]
MGEFAAAALSFPAVVLGVPLVLVVVFWLLAVLGVLDSDDVGFELGLGLGDFPAAISVSLLVAVSWFASLAGGVLVDQADLPPVPHTLLDLGVLLLSLLLGLLLTRLAIEPFRKPERSASRVDFVGRTCVVRTGTVTSDFGQAEVTSADGSSALVQVRQTGRDPFAAGDTAVIYQYDPDGEFFWVVPLNSSL